MTCQSGGVNDFDAAGGADSSFGGALQNAGAEQEGAAREAASIGGQRGGGLSWSSIGGSIIENFAKDFKPAAGASPAGISGMKDAANKVVKLAKKYKITTIIDNTWGTALYFNALKFGVDIVVEAITKYIGGHSDVMMGVTVCNKKYLNLINRWKKN